VGRWCRSHQESSDAPDLKGIIARGINLWLEKRVLRRGGCCVDLAETDRRLRSLRYGAEGKGVLVCMQAMTSCMITCEFKRLDSPVLTWNATFVRCKGERRAALTDLISLGDILGCFAPCKPFDSINQHI
jgi:hypothetical protein